MHNNNNSMILPGFHPHHGTCSCTCAYVTTGTESRARKEAARRGGRLDERPKAELYFRHHGFLPSDSEALWFSNPQYLSRNTGPSK